MNNNKGYIDNNLITTFTDAVFTSSEIQLFASHYSGLDKNLGNYSTYKLSYCRMWQNGKLVRSYMPVLRKSDNIAGLLDTVNNVFYPSVGTAQFTKGPELIFSVNI